MRRTGNEDGFALIAAIIVLAIIFALGMGILVFSDGQQNASLHEQASEAAFNVAEAALNAQIGELSRKWPNPEVEAARKAAGQEPEMPAACTSSTSTEENDCPSKGQLKLDPNTGSTSCSGTGPWGSSLSNQWTTYVRRDKEEEVGGHPVESLSFNSAEEQGMASYPAYPEAGALWVRAVGVVQCHEVAVVSLVTRLRIKLEWPEDAIVGNWFKVTNKGNKVIVNRIGNAAQAAPVSMRCEGKASLEECEQYEEQKEQVSPPLGSENPESSAATLTAEQLATLRSEAQSHGTFYSSSPPYHCPTSLTELEGVKLTTSADSPRAPVYVEECGELQITANGEANCTPEKPTEPESPGFLVIANGTFELSGTSRYCGIIYAANLQKSTGAVVRLQGGTIVVGGIIVDGAGGIEFGSSGQGGNPANLVYDSLAIHNLTISAGAASTRNSFRILPSGQ